MLPGMGQNLDTFIAKWAAAGAAERANKDMFLTELCGVLGVAPPNPAKPLLWRKTYSTYSAPTWPVRMTSDTS
jgi:hypothetical protein